MGLMVEKRDLETYWSTDQVLQTPGFREIMSRDRFEMILEMLHLNNNNNYIPPGRPHHDPLFKLRPILDSVLPRFRSVYTPHQHITIDEAMIAWKGKLRFRVYIPIKPDKFGIKTYKLCESVSGYTSTLSFYTGKHFDEHGSPVTVSTKEVVMGLLDECNLLNKGYKLYMDNFYTSPDLMDTLLAEGTMSCGTARINRAEMPME
ncbi:piggyBac transposable element-derived protein 4-like [Ptychodera flava]|uniref:piggyBac transposable element-derived protein 4-like n=1 Tax=Ptychodera flava TaxID=63121 RepID=UPI00396A2F99